MKLVHKIILANTLGIISIILVAGFSFHEFNLILAKLRFVEIADNLNASFLKMRISEKNYFLYNDSSALQLNKKHLDQSYLTIEGTQPDIIRAIGEKNFKGLKSHLRKYEETVAKIGETDKRAGDKGSTETAVRDAGRELRLFSERMIKVERQEVNKIISDSKRTLLTFFCLVIFVSITTTYLFFSRMFKNLRRIEKTANFISQGNFKKLEGKIPKNELGSAMDAINSMCEELKTRHEQLIQSRKLASLGTLTAGVAHELGNPLNNISMIAQTYLEVYDHLSGEERVDYMKTVLGETERIGQIIQDLLDFSRVKQRNFKISDINDVIKNSLRLAQNMINVSGIKTELELQEKLPPVFIDENKMREVFVNLLTNAIHAMSPKDTVSLRTHLTEKKDIIIIEIEDSGKGIRPEFLAHIFDPFFSTKGTEGTGLGLSISYGIIKKHKGTINVNSKPGVGTTFTIELPVYRSKEGTNE